MRPITLILALGAAMAAGAAWAEPQDDRADASPRCGSRADDARAACPARGEVIDRLPDSFFVGGGGVGPRVVDGGGGEHVWVHAGGGASAGASASAFASARASASVSVQVHGRR